MRLACCKRLTPCTYMHEVEQDATSAGDTHCMLITQRAAKVRTQVEIVNLLTSKDPDSMNRVRYD